MRTLAADADVAGSTVSRIQAGTVDPSIDTLRRILGAAGFTLQISAVREGTEACPTVADLADAWTYRVTGRVQLDWTRWRGLLDCLVLRPDLVPEAIYRPPWPTGEPVIDALLAAVAEKLADDAHLPRPVWAAATPALELPYLPPVARHVAGRSVPPQLAARSLMIDTESLWRDRQTTGA